MSFDDFLRKIGFLDSLTVQMEIEKHEFARLLRDHVDLEQVDLFEVFSSSRNDYKGFVSEDGFELRRKRRMFERSNMYVKAIGEFVQNGKQLTIDIDVNGFRNFWIFYYIILVFIYSVLLTIFIFNRQNISVQSGDFPFPFLIIHALFMLGFPYFYVRRSVARMKTDLERDLYFFTKK